MLISFSFILQLLFFLASFSISNSNFIYVRSTCSNTNNYTNSFGSDLNTFLSSVPQKVESSDWFYNNIVGKVYGLAMCYYDMPSCSDCINTAAWNITLKCPNSTSAALWFDTCFIRYSDQNFFSKASTGPFDWEARSESQIDEFMQAVISLMRNLTINVTSPHLFAEGEGNYSIASQIINIYGLVECTRDLNVSQCQKSLNAGVDSITTNCTYKSNGAIGCRIYGLSCFLRYEPYSFSRSISLSPPPQVLPPQAAPPQALSSLTTPTPEKKKIVFISVASAVVLLITIIGASFWIRRKRGNMPWGNVGSKFPPGTELTVFDFKTLRDATNNFSKENMLGEGGFGKVFKGKLQNGPEIAVKRMSKASVQGVAELKNEVELLVKLKHINLVQVLGCCIEGDEKLLVYEYLPNGSLDTILFANDSARREKLDWETRFKIIEGICHGLVYLHDESRFKIIHRDLKASNVLLDLSMNPKISDFGLARLFLEDQTHKTTNIVAGTLGYIAPEYLMNLVFSAKSDVFSFGVLILEIVTGRRCKSNLISFVWHHWSEGELLELKDAALPPSCLDQVTKCTHIGLLCVQQNPDHRPTISELNVMLDNLASSYLPAVPPRSSIWGAQLMPVSENSTSREFPIPDYDDKMDSTSSEYIMMVSDDI